MRKTATVIIAVLAVALMILTGCGGGTTTTTSAPPTTTASPTGTTTTTATSTPSETPVSGGIVKAITTAGPAMMSYRGMMGPADATYTFPVAEYLVEPEAQPDGSIVYIPFLCESFNVDPNAGTFTFNLRHGVMFSDGSEMTASVVKWNFQQDIDNGWLQKADQITSIDTPDNYTVVIHFKEYSNAYTYLWGWTTIFSEQAWINAAGSDNTTAQAGIDWAVGHCVGTGPFILDDYQTDVSMTFTKNPNYWQQGKPYLDGIKFEIIPDATTAAAALQSGEVDFWYQGSSALDWKNFKGMGYNVLQYKAGLYQGLFPNTVSPDSKFQDIKLREALEYALDKPAIAQALGFGFYPPLDQLAGQGNMGYDPSLQVRGYDVAKAKQLVSDAGFPNGCPISLLIQNVPASVDAGESIKGYLDQAGFQTTLDLADPGRFFASVFGTGWDDVVQMFYGMVDLNSYFDWFSTDPKSNLADMARTDYQHQEDSIASTLPTSDEQNQAMQKLLDSVYDAANVIPLWVVPAVTIAPDYFHHDTYKHGFIREDWENFWMAPH
jgi:peptide/nickel transport system substrate-binding protein